MNTQEIVIRKARKVEVPLGDKSPSEYDTRTLAFQAEVMRLGFIMSKELAMQVSTLSKLQLATLHKEILPILSKMVGDDVSYEPFYPNFPTQVLAASDAELFLNAICHYWTLGEWKPNYTKIKRLPEFEDVKFRELGLATSDTVKEVFQDILASNASVSDYDKEVLRYILTNHQLDELSAFIPSEIPFKEQLCLFVGECMNKNVVAMTGAMMSCKTATDILRVVTHLSGGDISLAENTKYKSLNRTQRYVVVARLEAVINADDVFRHKNKWVRLAHMLHIGEFKRKAPAVFTILSNARDRKYKHRGFDSQVEDAIAKRDSQRIHDLLKTRPGLYARRLDHVVRIFPDKLGEKLAWLFIQDVAAKVDTRVLLQLFGHFKTRTNAVTSRLVISKGTTSVGHLLKDTIKKLPQTTVDLLLAGIQTTLLNRFSTLPTMGKVFIDPAMKDCPVPLSLRSASDGLETIGRGTKIPISVDKDTLRMFIYWKGQDIDLSASCFDDDLNKVFDISWRNLREVKCKSAHSGDITSAPNGASEFIDIDITSAMTAGARYLAMQVYIFRGPTFKGHETCYAGWMTRNAPGSNEIYDPKTVEQKITITADSKSAMPVIFDLRQRKAIWLDLALDSNSFNTFMYGNSVEGSRAEVMDMIRGAMSLENKPTLYDLFSMHATARGQLVNAVYQADKVFSWDGDVKPTHVNTILSEFL